MLLQISLSAHTFPDVTEPYLFSISILKITLDSIEHLNILLFSVLDTVSSKKKSSCHKHQRAVTLLQVHPCFSVAVCPVCVDVFRRSGHFSLYNLLCDHFIPLGGSNSLVVICPRSLKGPEWAQTRQTQHTYLFKFWVFCLVFSAQISGPQINIFAYFLLHSGCWLPFKYTNILQCNVGYIFHIVISQCFSTLWSFPHLPPSLWLCNRPTYITHILCPYTLPLLMTYMVLYLHFIIVSWLYWSTYGCI